MTIQSKSVLRWPHTVYEGVFGMKKRTDHARRRFRIGLNGGTVRTGTRSNVTARCI